MKAFLNQCAVIARRDFLAVVATPTFLLFLFAPLVMILIAVLGGSGASEAAQSSANAARIAIYATPADTAMIKTADERLRKIGIADMVPTLEIIPSQPDDAARARALFGSIKQDYFAVMYGSFERPVIIHQESSLRSVAMLSAIAEDIVRAKAAGTAQSQTLSKPQLQPLTAQRGGIGGRRTTAYFAVFGIFFLTLMLAGQAVGMLAEEKSNKVIEILAAAVPLEAVFLGKLVGMFGVAMLFVSFWSALIGGALLVAGGGEILGTMVDPAVGILPFFLLCALYFTMSYMLLGAIFLGIGAQAATVRDIQMLSLPITILQVAMYGVASKGVADPQGNFARFAEIFPLSSPYAMAGHAANDPALWPHFMALGWQALWVAGIIYLSARLFRLGVLKSGGGFWAIFSRAGGNRTAKPV